MAPEPTKNETGCMIMQGFASSCRDDYHLLMVTVGIVGASGYTGAELLRLCAGHPDLDVVVATGDTQAGTPAADLYPSLAPAYPDLVFRPYDAADFAGLDVVFLGLPHTGAEEVAPELVGKVHAVIDL